MIQTCPTGMRYKPDQCKCDVWDEKEVKGEYNCIKMCCVCRDNRLHGSLATHKI